MALKVTVKRIHSDMFFYHLGKTQDNLSWHLKLQQVEEENGILWMPTPEPELEPKEEKEVFITEVCAQAIRNQLATYYVSVPPADYLTDWETKLTLEHNRECRTTMQEFAVSIGHRDYYLYEEAVTTIHITMLEDLPLPLTSTVSLPTDHILKHVRQLYQNAFIKEAAQTSEKGSRLRQWSLNHPNTSPIEQSVLWSIMIASTGMTEEADHEETDNFTTIDFMAVRETNLANFEGWDLTRGDEAVIDINPSDRVHRVRQRI
ncbi:hypothetical protein BDZ97DRAFT_1762199 [Flammula alnicola]|nr:hypothetical protein BDZ97DRAFT_1762199 [Flammula alnicola]